MGLKRTKIESTELQSVAEEDGFGALGLSQTETSCRRVTASVLSVTHADEGVILEVDQSPLFPGGGGQPADHGWVNGKPILSVLGHTQLLVREAPAEATIEIDVDWDRRFDLMQQHTAQHVISGLALSEFSLATLSFHLSLDTAFVVFDTAELSDGVVASLEARTNEVIRDARAVVPRLAEDADFEPGRIRCRKLPDKRSGGLRLVEIEGLDLNTCGGTHVNNTAALQMIRLIKKEPHRGATRVYFEAGGRVLSRLRRDAAVHYEVNQLLSCSVEQYAEQIDRIQKEVKSAGKKIKYLEMMIAEQQANAFALDGVQDEYVFECVDKDMAQLNRMIQILSTRKPETAFVLLSKQAADDWLVLMTGSENWLANRGKAILSGLGGRGGGKGRLQGRVSSCTAVRAFLDAGRLSTDGDAA